jgi:hypothetical protein
MVVSHTAADLATRPTAPGSGKHSHVVDYQRVIHALRKKPMALLKLIYLDQLFLRRAYVPAFEALLTRETACLRSRMTAPARPAIKVGLDASKLPNLGRLHQHFKSDRATVPDVAVRLAPPSANDEPVVVCQLTAKPVSPEGGMKAADSVDAARFELFLADFAPASDQQVWAALAEQSDKEGWPAARFLAVLAEHEIARSRPSPHRAPLGQRQAAGQAETGVLFQLIGRRCERRSKLITSGGGIGTCGPALRVAVASRVASAPVRTPTAQKKSRPFPAGYCGTAR